MASVNQEPVTAKPAAAQAATAVASGWGNSAPLALAAFAVTTFMLSLINANIVPAGTTPVVFAVAFMFGGLAQLIAGLICLRNGNDVGVDQAEHERRHREGGKGQRGRVTPSRRDGGRRLHRGGPGCHGLLVD